MIALKRKGRDLVKRILIFLFLFLFLLSGCGSSAPDAMTTPAGALEHSETNNAPSAIGSTKPAQSADYGDDTEPAETQAPSEAANDNYFIFSRGNDVSLSEDGTELLYEYSCDVTFESLDPAIDQWIDSILEQIQGEYSSNSENLLQYARDSLEQNGKEYFYGFSNYQEIAVARHDRKIVSLLVLSSIYSGGAHSNAVQTAWNLDMEQGSVLTLADILCESAAQQLAELVRQSIDEKFQSLGQGALFDGYEQTIEDAFRPDMMTPYWYLTDEGLTVFFNQYELGPYAAGIIKTLIRYEDLEGILREEYFPGKYAQIPGDMLLNSRQEGYRTIPITVERDGEQILIGVEGEVFRVQLSEIYWLEGTAIGQRMLFSADSLDENDVLQLTGGFNDETRSFAVEFADGTGNTLIYYIHPEGLLTEP